MGFFDKFKSSRDIAKEEIKEVANKYLSENYLLGILMPEKKEGQASEAGE